MTTDLFELNEDIDSHAMFAKILGLLGESGEVAEKFKKIFRDKLGKATDEDKLEIAKELGDVLWYVNAVSRYLGFSLEQIAQMNLDKLASRRSHGNLAGSGDNR